MPFGLINMPVVFIDTMNSVFHKYLDQFTLVIINDIPIYFKIQEEHGVHL